MLLLVLPDVGQGLRIGYGCDSLYALLLLALVDQRTLDGCHDALHGAGCGGRADNRAADGRVVFLLHRQQIDHLLVERGEDRLTSIVLNVRVHDAALVTVEQHVDSFAIGGRLLLDDLLLLLLLRLSGLLLLLLDVADLFELLQLLLNSDWK